MSLQCSPVFYAAYHKCGEREDIYSHGEKVVEIADNSEGQNPLIPKIRYSNSKAMQCLVHVHLCGVNTSIWKLSNTYNEHHNTSTYSMLYYSGPEEIIHSFFHVIHFKQGLK